jgi:hypothetical protein
VHWRHIRHRPVDYVLDITLANGSICTFDGIIAQYGWNNGQSWLLSGVEFEANLEHLGTLSWYRTSNERAEVRNIVINGCDDYWSRTAVLVKEFLAQVDWASLQGLSAPELRQRIEDQARSTFSG